MFGFMKKVKEFFVGKPANTELLFPKSYEPKEHVPSLATYETQIAVPNTVFKSKGIEGATWSDIEVPTVTTTVVEEAVAAVEETPKKKRPSKKAKLPLKEKKTTRKKV